ncbi:MAG: S8 family serine peptidase, partial [Nitrosopumilaceae archaeon]|nr:S8 family serine peptidase [Nitrosopumilaceae archaeon]
MNKGLSFSILFSMSLLLFFGSVVTPLNSFAQPNSNANFVPGKYIVVLQDDVDPTTFAKSKGAMPEFVYEYALNGFSTSLSPNQVNQLSQDPRVKSIEQDQVAHIFSQPPPTGIDRIDAESASIGSGQGVTVAIIDTGIDLDHPDLQTNINLEKSVVCIEKSPVKPVNCTKGGDDDNGHGSHVAGTVAAIDNSIGVVGVAPQAELWAIKVLDNQGSGRMSWIIAGIDYVTANKPDVANMSLGCECESTALDNAISNSVAAGVTYVVAAGNSGKDASSFSPANHPDVITVSAIADSDGQCGSQGGPTSYGDDDTFASFSNFGSLVEIAAPGVDIYSTYMGGSYATASGTSMASPHVAGAAALLIASDSTLDPAQVRSALINNGVSQNAACTSNTGLGGFGGDSDGYSEPLVYVGNTSVGDFPVVSISSPTDGSSYGIGDSILFEGSATDTEDGDLTSNLSWTSNIDGAIGTGGSFSATLSDGSHTITASVTDSDGNSSSDSVSITVVNNPPSVSITSPSDGTSFDSGASVLFEGSATDTEDGDLTSNLSWTSNIDGVIGSGGSFSATLSDGSHTITA